MKKAAYKAYVLLALFAWCSVPMVRAVGEDVTFSQQQETLSLEEVVSRDLARVIEYIHNHVDCALCSGEPCPCRETMLRSCIRDNSIIPQIAGVVQDPHFIQKTLNTLLQNKTLEQVNVVFYTFASQWCDGMVNMLALYPEGLNINEALTHAARAGNGDAVEHLIVKCKADMNYQSAFGYTPYQAAIQKGHQSIVSFMEMIREATDQGMSLAQIEILAAMMKQVIVAVPMSQASAHQVSDGDDDAEPSIWTPSLRGCLLL
jgi:hypothetical protein